MADDVPASLRQADPNIYKTATRAAQLQSVKPIVAYWCDYWVLKQILARGLHNGDAEILDFSTQLMDKMEQTKSEHGSEDAITDDTAGQAYVEQFAQETLDRAQRVVRAGKVTVQTANTFDAAATFFALVNIWGTPDPETLQKIKYAKWNATRILKAIKEGKDPNESNPQLDELSSAPEQGDEQSPPPMNLPMSPRAGTAAAAATVPRPVTIEDEPDRALHPGTTHHLRRDSAGVSLPHSPASVASDHVAPKPSQQQQPPPPPPPPPPGYNDNDGGMGDGSGGGSDGGIPALSLPSAPPAAPSTLPDWSTAAPPSLPSVSPPSHPYAATPPADFLPSAPGAQPSASTPEPYYQQQPQSPSQPFPSTFSPPVASYNTPTGYPPPTGYAPANNTPPAGYPPPAARAPPPPAQPRAQPPPPNNAVVDDVAMVNAQKHAKWAISALNFEDVTTAVRELQLALEFLGAR